MARSEEPEALQGPIHFGPYTLARRIGAGGMGEVYLAREESPRRACVVKKVLPKLMENKQFIGRFRDEARVVVHLQHPNIARVYAMGEVEGQLFLSMEYVQGKTLSRLAYRMRQKGQVMPVGVILHIGERLCQGLAYAHDAKDGNGQPLQLVHRDLSPANICLSYDGELKVIDFGASQSTLKEQKTAPRVVIGNLTYMSPEQARKKLVDRRADVYAAGVVLWELLAWHPLPQKGDPLERWRRAAYPKWEPASRFRAGLPQGVDALLMRALSVEPGERFQDAAELGAELARLKAKLAPEIGDADVARLMREVFAEEKTAEDKVLAELLGKDPSRALTEQAIPAMLAPPTALAFEHSGLDAPEDYVPWEEPSSAGTAPKPKPKPPPRRETREARVSFGMDMATDSDVGLVEARRSPLVRAIEEGEEESPAPAPVEEATPGNARWVWLAVGLFLGASAVGFGVVWLLAL
ncbi:serine/threonine protein kinase [Hyalangium rubrum]|uniref:Serine/threonine-protein kinase n=1 Tax=Hyalangium rubrum TaxID=3103134 RepID=A0ABU5H059_9BACT|nr:serine/threonine-protein kinase [Hyalangium sp. s54d21]MDY7226168.1 serine/threonine-protein kinase [Hyalangium sp. s54d21]